jgi:hypothetical protein
MTNDQRVVNVAEGVTLWLLLFLIAFGLGYPTLNRYEPRAVNGTSDSADYSDLVTAGPAAVEGKMRFRVLVPYVAKPFYWLARGRVKTWNPVFFGLLVANALFTATTAYLLFLVGRHLVEDRATALLATTLFLLNFNTANYWLSGMVDSSEGCCLMLLTWTLFSRRWWLLPVWGALGALTKESFIPLSIVYGATWWLVWGRARADSFSRGVWVGAMSATSVVTMIILQSLIAGHVLWPWQFAATVEAVPNYFRNLATLFLDRNFWYNFAWLLPLGVWRLKTLPRTWVLASATTVVLGVLLSAYVPPGGLVGRVTFDIAGPILSLSAAVLLCRPQTARHAEITQV